MPVHERYKHFVKDQRKFFDELITEDWDTYQNKDWDFSRRFEVERLFRNISPRSILDVGCGCGFHDMVMAEYPTVEKVVGIDYSAASIQKANEAYPHPKVIRKVSDIQSEVPDGNYDLVVSFQVLEHLETPDFYFRYCVQACDKNGFVAIATPNLNRLDNRLLKLVGRPPRMLDPMHAREFTLAQLVDLASGYGLTLHDSFGMGLHSMLFPWMTPKPHESSVRWGARLPGLATGIVAVFKKS